MLYEITLESPTGQQETDQVDLPLDPELTWQEFCGAEAFTQWLQDRARWRVIDITPEDMISVARPDEPEVESDVEPEVDVPLNTVLVETDTVETAEPEPEPEPQSRFIDSWSGRTTKNTEFTQWMAKAKLNGINELTFKSRVYKLGWDYARAATEPRGPQGSTRQRLAKLKVD